MRKNLILVVVLAFVLSGCAAISTNRTGKVGRNGWMVKEILPNRLIRVERPGSEVEIGPYEGSTYFVRSHRPGGEVNLPPFPGAESIDLQNRPLWVNRIYSIPRSADFEDVYDYYMDWFDFQDVD